MYSNHLLRIKENYKKYDYFFVIFISDFVASVTAKLQQENT